MQESPAQIQWSEFEIAGCELTCFLYLLAVRFRSLSIFLWNVMFKHARTLSNDKIWQDFEKQNT